MSIHPKETPHGRHRPYVSSFREVPESLWRWPDFSPAEIACRGTGRLKLHPKALDTLQALRDRLGKPLIVRSAYRSPAHNRAVGGAPRSKHMDGTAFDIAMSNHDPVAFEAAAREVGFLGFGFYPRSGFMHVDLGPARSWGDPFPVRAVRICSRDVARARGAGRKPDAEGHRGGGARQRSARLASRSRRRCSPRRRALSCRWCRISTPSAGCSSRWRWAGSPSPSGRASTTGARGGADVGTGCWSGSSARPWARRVRVLPSSRSPSPCSSSTSAARPSAQAAPPSG